MSGQSSMVQLPHLAGHKSRTVSRLEDSATQTQVEESFFSENKDETEVPLLNRILIEIDWINLIFILKDPAVERWSETGRNGERIEASEDQAILDGSSPTAQWW
jgi:hypothetical protein